MDSVSLSRVAEIIRLIGAEMGASKIGDCPAAGLRTDRLVIGHHNSRQTHGGPLIEQATAKGITPRRGRKPTGNGQVIYRQMSAYATYVKHSRRSAAADGQLAGAVS